MVITVIHQLTQFTISPLLSSWSPAPALPTTPWVVLLQLLRFWPLVALVAWCGSSDQEVGATIFSAKNIKISNDRLGLTRSAILLVLFIVIHAVGNLHVFKGPDDFNGYGYFYVRLYWTGFGLPANIVEEGRSLCHGDVRGDSGDSGDVRASKLALEFQIFKNPLWSVFYIFSVAVFMVHACLGWKKVTPVLGIPRGHIAKVEIIGFLEKGTARVIER
eukprot:Skav213891  [mRNA]  locus=scaffold245:208194:218086:- [translate_table: standard]